MDSKTFISIIVFFLFLSLISVKADYAECYCKFKGNWVIAQSAKYEDCMERCGKTVGGQTACEDNCQSCCEEWCSKVKEDESREGCEGACQKTCGFKKNMSDIISLFYIASGIVAAIMLTINGMRLFSSENPARREEAKRGIWYILLALGIVVIGGMFITYLMEGLTKTAPEAGVIQKVEGCGGIILNVHHKFSGDNIEVYTEFMNNGDRKCIYGVALYGKKKEAGTKSYLPVSSGGIKEVKISVTRSELSKEYSVRLFKIKGVFKEIDYWGPVPLES